MPTSPIGDWRVTTQDVAHSESLTAIGAHHGPPRRPGAQSPRWGRPERVAAKPPHDDAERRPGILPRNAPALTTTLQGSLSIGNTTNSDTGVKCERLPRSSRDHNHPDTLFAAASASWSLNGCEAAGVGLRAPRPQLPTPAR